jgi:predicted Zn-dependent protease
MNGLRYILSFLGIAAIASMYFLLPKSQKNKNVVESMPSMASAFDINSFINESKAELSEADLNKLNQWDADKTDKAKQKTAFYNLAEYWARAKKSTIAAYYSAQLAETINADSTWEAAGDDAMLAFRNAQIPIEKQFNIQQAEKMYNKALSLNSADLQTKIKLASTYVEGGTAPMKGIQMLLAEAEKDPNNIQINITLGQFSVMSGQLDKAIARFDKVLAVDKKNVEAMYLKAEALRMTGKKQEAIELLQKCISIVQLPEIKNELEQYLTKLKSE